jgi:antitoxin (DNA-binding transcriptional repressor) of toxin-antitoxin stability system
MEVPITQFRREMFALVNRALEGETITVAYKGKRLRIVPEAEPKSRFHLLTPLQVINPDYPDLDDADMKAEIQAEMEADWKNL